MSSGNERKSSNAVVNKDQVQKPNSLPNSAVAIPRGKYLTIAQVTETCGVNKNYQMVEKRIAKEPRSGRFGANR